MKRILSLILFLVMFPAVAIADVTALGEVSAAFQASGDIPFANQQTKPARLPIGSTGQILVVGSNGFPTWASTGGALGDATFISLTSIGNGTISTNTVDTADNAAMCIAGAGACTASGVRGGYATFAGNESSDTGSVRIQSGNLAGGIVSIYAPNSSSKITMGVGAGSDEWQINGSAQLKQDTNGAAFVMPLAGTANKGVILGKSAVAADASISTPLYVFGDASSAPNVTIAEGTADSTSGILRLIKSRATDGSADTIVASNDNVGIIAFQGADGATFRDAAAIFVKVDGTPGVNDMPGSMDFQLSPDGSSTTASVLKLSQDKSALFTGTVRSSATADIGWSAVNAANQACNTTCTSACVFGMNTGALGNFVGCADATADTCICAGAS